MGENYTVSAPLRILCGGKKLFGPGIAALLEGIRRNGSIRRTASEMSMSYNKAWGILRTCEQALGFSLLERQVDGVHGGGAKLTAQGQIYLRGIRHLTAKRRRRCKRCWISILEG